MLTLSIICQKTMLTMGSLIFFGLIENVSRLLQIGNKTIFPDLDCEYFKLTNIFKLAYDSGSLQIPWSGLTEKVDINY